MLRTLLLTGLLALAGLVVLKVVFGLLGPLVSALFWLVGMALRVLLAAAVGRLPHMVGVGACRVHLDPVLPAALGDLVAHDAVGRGAAADVAHADKGEPIAFGHAAGSGFFRDQSRITSSPRSEWG